MTDIFSAIETELGVTPVQIRSGLQQNRTAVDARQIAIVLLWNRGRSNLQIANELNLHRSTVGNRVQKHRDMIESGDRDYIRKFERVVQRLNEKMSSSVTTRTMYAGNALKST